MQEHHASDESLVAQARAGDQAAFAQLIESAQQDLVAYARRKLCGRRVRRISAHDLTQQTLFNAWKGVAGLRHDSPEMFRVWLMAIHRNVVAGAIRQALRAPIDVVALEDNAAGTGEFDPCPADAGPSPSRAARRAELKQRLLDAMASLTPKQQIVVRLRFLEELKYDEIAERTGLTPGAIQRQLRGALEALRKQTRTTLKDLLTGLTSM